MEVAVIGALLYVVQTVTVAPGDTSALPNFSTIPRCPRDLGDGDVVVCGRAHQDQYRLRPLPPRYHDDDHPLPAAALPLGGGTLGATAAQGNVGGVNTPRAMLTWKLKF